MPEVCFAGVRATAQPKQLEGSPWPESLIRISPRRTSIARPFGAIAAGRQLTATERINLLFNPDSDQAYSHRSGRAPLRSGVQTVTIGRSSEFGRRRMGAA